MNTQVQFELFWTLFFANIHINSESSILTLIKILKVKSKTLLLINSTLIHWKKKWVILYSSCEGEYSSL